MSAVAGTVLRRTENTEHMFAVVEQAAVGTGYTQVEQELDGQEKAVGAVKRMVQKDQRTGQGVDMGLTEVQSMGNMSFVVEAMAESR